MRGAGFTLAVLDDLIEDIPPARYMILSWLKRLALFEFDARMVMLEQLPLGIDRRRKRRMLNKAGRAARKALIDKEGRRR